MSRALIRKFVLIQNRENPVMKCSNQSLKFFVELSLLGRVVALIPVAWRILDLCLWLSEKETALKAS